MFRGLLNTIIGLSVALTVATFGAYVVRADETATQDVTVVITDAGQFAVTLTAGGGDAPTFGPVAVDAIGDQVVTQTFMLEYTDTQTERGPGVVTLSVDSFEPVSPVPAFDGSDQAHFQIPNRYLMLEEVGDVVAAPGGPACGGAITATSGEEGQSFDNGVARTVANVTGTCGIGSASQEIDLTLTVPAGVYPTTYSATVTIETTVES